MVDISKDSYYVTVKETESAVVIGLGEPELQDVSDSQHQAVYKIFGGEDGVKNS